MPALLIRVIRGKKTKSIDEKQNSRLDGTMKIKTLIITLTLGVAAAGVCLAGDTKIEQALRDLDAQWSKAAEAKDLDKTVSYYSKDAIVLPPNGPAANTKEAIRKVWGDMFAVIVNGSWKATRVEVAKSGDMAYLSGTYEFTTKDTSGNQVNDRGKYVAVFEKQPDGSWKCGADIWNSDLPASASGETK